MEDKTGGPAFPQRSGYLKHFDDDGEPTGTTEPQTDNECTDDSLSSAGISTRDYFAAAALTGLLSDTGQPVNISIVDGKKMTTTADFQKHFAAVAYGYADAMIAERAKAKP